MTGVSKCIAMFHGGVLDRGSLDQHAKRLLGITFLGIQAYGLYRLVRWTRRMAPRGVTAAADDVARVVTGGDFVDIMPDINVLTSRDGPWIVRHSVLILRAEIGRMADRPDNRLIVARNFRLYGQRIGMRPTHIAQWAPVVVEAFFLPIPADFLAKAVAMSDVSIAAKDRLQNLWVPWSFLSWRARAPEADESA